MSTIRQCAIRSHTSMRICSINGREARRAYASSSSVIRSPVESRTTTSSTITNELPPDLSLSDSVDSLSSVMGSTTIREADRLPHLKSMLEMAHTLKESNYMQNNSSRTEELNNLINTQGPLAEEGLWPVWIEQEFRSFQKESRAKESTDDKSFRKARSMLWTPKDFDETTINKMIVQHEENLIDSMQNVWKNKSREEQLDVILRSSWDQLSSTEKEEALLSARFNSVRKLGWRRGYTSGYPTSEESERQSRLESMQKIKTGTSAEAREIIARLNTEEERDAWNTWQSLSERERSLEERRAWELRDRSLIFIDDTSGSYVTGVRSARWYSSPQRSGETVFLPNDVIKLVRNTTRTGDQYDAFKATFRVPLHMHKHGIRSYLLAIYGLRTTWIRSMIYRAAITRNRLGQKVVGSSQRTFKKIEVGLLEPFVFPELTEGFAREHLLSEEMKDGNTTILFKMGKRQRWRTKRYPDPIRFDPHSAAIEESTLTTKLEANKEAKHTKRNESEKKSSTDQNRLNTFSGGIPTKRHSRILQMLNDQRKIREAKIASEAQTLKNQSESNVDQ